MHLKNADAAKLAEVLRAAFGAGAGGTVGGAQRRHGGSPTPAPQQALATRNTAGAGGASAPATAPLTPSAQPVHRRLHPGRPGDQFADHHRARAALSPAARDDRPARLAPRAGLHRKHDRRGRRGDNAADFGFQWQGLIGKNGDKTGLAAGTNFGSTGNIIVALDRRRDARQRHDDGRHRTPAINIGEGLNVAVIRNFAGVYALAAIARLLQSQTNTNIVSTPNLITLDNEEAKIIVGQNVPFITGQFTATGTAATNPFQTIERKDVGITLRIKPQIGENGVVRMQIFQESSSCRTASRPAPATPARRPTSARSNRRWSSTTARSSCSAA